jgi:hypothetical protein
VLVLTAFTHRYNCKNSDGVSASPKARTVIVDPAQIDDWWEGEAQIQIGGAFSHSKPKSVIMPTLFCFKDTLQKLSVRSKRKSLA